jgi:hypothetical protein
MPNMPLTASAMAELALTSNGNGNAHTTTNGRNGLPTAAIDNPVAVAWKRYEQLKQADDAKNQLIEVCICPPAFQLGGLRIVNLESSLKSHSRCPEHLSSLILLLARNCEHLQRDRGVVLRFMP